MLSSATSFRAQRSCPFYPKSSKWGVGEYSVLKERRKHGVVSDTQLAADLLTLPLISADLSLRLCSRYTDLHWRKQRYKQKCMHNKTWNIPFLVLASPRSHLLISCFCALLVMLVTTYKQGDSRRWSQMSIRCGSAVIREYISKDVECVPSDGYWHHRDLGHLNECFLAKREAETKQQRANFRKAHNKQGQRCSHIFIESFVHVYC